MFPRNTFPYNFWTSSIKFIAKIAISLHWYSAEQPTSEGREEKVAGFFSIFPKYPFQQHWLYGAWWLGIVLIRSDDGSWWIHYGDDEMITHIPSHHQHSHGPSSSDWWSSGHHPSSDDEMTRPWPARIAVINLATISPAAHPRRCGDMRSVPWWAGAMSRSRESCSSRIWLPGRTGGNSFSGRGCEWHPGWHVADIKIGLNWVTPHNTQDTRPPATKHSE